MWQLGLMHICSWLTICQASNQVSFLTNEWKTKTISVLTHRWAVFEQDIGYRLTICLTEYQENSFCHIFSHKFKWSPNVRRQTTLTLNVLFNNIGSVDVTAAYSHFVGNLLRKVKLFQSTDNVWRNMQTRNQYIL